MHTEYLCLYSLIFKVTSAIKLIECWINEVHKLKEATRPTRSYWDLQNCNLLKMFIFRLFVLQTWSNRVSRMDAPGTDVVPALARACLALEPLALPAGALLAKLERVFTTPNSDGRYKFQNHIFYQNVYFVYCCFYFADKEEPEYKRIAEVLFDFMCNTYEVRFCYYYYYFYTWGQIF